MVHGSLVSVILNLFNTTPYSVPTKSMSPFNIFKAFTSGNKGHRHQENIRGPAGPYEPPTGYHAAHPIPNVEQPPVRRRPRTLTKPRYVDPRSQPSYSVRREDIGHYDLGRYPSTAMESAVDDLNPPQYRDTIPEYNYTRLEYPTLADNSFRPISQSTRRWSPIPDVHRATPTEEYDDSEFTNTVRLHRRSLVRQDNKTSGKRGPSPHIRIHDEFSHHELPGDALVEYEGPSDMTSGGPFPHTISHDHGSLAFESKRSYGAENQFHRVTEIIEPMIFEHEIPGRGENSNPKIWHYIVPGGLDVIFKDEDGNVLTRVRNVGKGSNRRQVTPMIIEDEFGNVVYRTGDFDSLSSSSRTASETSQNRFEYPYESRYRKTGQHGHSHHEPTVRAPAWVEGRVGSPVRHVYTSYLSPDAEKVILIDENGRQIPIADRRASAKRAGHHDS
ncbi:hypothetical protein AMATHDRAFT_3097 [Amanita thiersii Skay4041]|uniref:Uncharacterized protein n=1 Tax=Amanita thiersii Skay4041 TaxID=703135 RepID=A0A2A9NT15_9AGAR|nr:hypothetical protein AMATHDRAFT_3097 [Amanita thiersii Skay4041]